MTVMIEVVKVVRDGESGLRVESKNPDGTVDTTPLALDMKVQKRMEGRSYQFFYASRVGDSWRLKAYAPYQPW